MKSMYALLSIVALNFTGLSQVEVNATAPANNTSSEACQVVYNQEENVIMLQQASTSPCNELVFEMLPPVTQTLVPMRLALKKGTYTFKKHNTLEVPAGYTYLIEDTMTGGTFDFSKERPFTFNVTRSVPDRFVMFISKSKTASVAAK